MQSGQKDYAIRKAHEVFDSWNDVTGLVPKFCGYYYELLSVIEDSVNIGCMTALNIDFKIKDGKPVEIKKRPTL